MSNDYVQLKDVRLEWSDPYLQQQFLLHYGELKGQYTYHERRCSDLEQDLARIKEDLERKDADLESKKVELTKEHKRRVNAEAKLKHSPKRGMSHHVLTFLASIAAATGMLFISVADWQASPIPGIGIGMIVFAFFLHVIAYFK